MLEYRILHHIDELEQAVDMEISVWGLDPRFAVPSNLMHAVAHSDGGGVVIGAYDDGRMVGMSFGLPARRENQWVLWSHMTGVHPNYQRRGVGFGLKQAQREWALQYGYNVIGWTFDPLQRGNANFNLHRLGAIACIYHPNLYGEMTDTINAGLPSDRLEATWILRDERVVQLANGEPAAPLINTYPDMNFRLKSSTDGRPIVSEAAAAGSRWHFVEIPFNLKQLKSSSLALALEWQLALRQTLQQAFAQGEVVVDFVTLEDHCWYVLRASIA
jgi:predicted GNAT superfamily acetyltransferase